MQATGAKIDLTSKAFTPSKLVQRMTTEANAWSPVSLAYSY
jgi:hypothetical protein